MNIRNVILSSLLLLPIVANVAEADTGTSGAQYLPCRDDSTKYRARSAELQQIVVARKLLAILHSTRVRVGTRVA